MTCLYCYSPQPIFSAYDYFSRKGFVLILPQSLTLSDRACVLKHGTLF